MRVLRRGALLAMLAACDTAVLPDQDVFLFRNPTAPVGSQADVSAADLSGEWIVRQAAAGAWPAGAGTVQFATGGADLQLAYSGPACDPAGVCFTVEALIDYTPTQAGRWIATAPALADEAGLPGEIWVYWMDFDRRTTALGNPNGSFVAILDRSATGGGDRITAARDILDWYGYDLANLTEGS